MTYPHDPRRPSHAGAIVGAVFAGLWLVFVAVVSQSTGWLATQLTLAIGLELPAYAWPVIGVVAALLAGLPALLLMLIPKHVPTREAGRVWTIGAGALGIGSAVRAIPGTHHEGLLIVLAIGAGIAALVLRRRSPERVPASRGWAVVAGLLVLAPYLWFGALGGPLQTILAILAAAAVGALASSCLDGRFWAAYDTTTARRVMLGGLVGGVTLCLIAAGSGGDGAQLLLLLVLPPLAFAAAALRRAWPLVAIAAFGPLGFVDPVEVNLFLLERDIPYWVSVAAAASWLIALLVGLTYALTLGRTRPTRPPATTPTWPAPNVPPGWSPPPSTPAWHGVTAGQPSPPDTVASTGHGRDGDVAGGGRPGKGTRLGIAVATVVVIGAGVLYAVAGQPGFFGDRLFVVLKDQASLAGLPTTTGLGSGRDARVAAVYQRLVEHAERTQKDLRAELDRWRLTYRPYYLVNGIMVSGGPEVRAWLELRGDVDRVMLDQRLRPLPAAPLVSRGDVMQPPDRPEWNVELVGAPEAWQSGYTGKGIVVGSSDSGADGAHPALAASYRGGDDSWFDPWEGTTIPNDSNGHGTHTLATAVGRQNVGVAPDAQWVSCVNLDRGLGSPSLYLDCLQFMLAPFPHGGDPFKDGRPGRAPHVLTNSWGCPSLEGCDDTAIRPATDALAAAGIAFVAAAGNTGPRCGSIEEPPAVDPSAFTVAAVDNKSQVADFSSRGRSGSGKPDIAAPGAHVLSAMPDKTYAHLDGTSMATPHVAGVIALLWSARPALIGDLDATYRLLEDTAGPVTGEPTCGGTEDDGAGIVNAERAIG